MMGSPRSSIQTRIDPEALHFRLPWERFDGPLAVIDIETTGLSSVYCRIIEIAVIRIARGEPVRILESLVNPGGPMGATHVHGLRWSDVKDAPTFEQLIEAIDELTGDAVMVAHNAAFETRFLKAEYGRAQHRWRRPSLCTAQLSRGLHRDTPSGQGSHRLSSLCDRYQIHNPAPHRALGDAWSTAVLLERMLGAFGTQDPATRTRLTDALHHATRSLRRGERAGPRLGGRQLSLMEALRTRRQAEDDPRAPVEDRRPVTDPVPSAPPRDSSPAVESHPPEPVSADPAEQARALAARAERRYRMPAPLGSGPLAVVGLVTDGAGAHGQILDFAVLRIEPGQATVSLHSLVAPERPVRNLAGLGIDPGELAAAPTFAEVVPQLLELFDGARLVAFDARFVTRCLRTAFLRAESGMVAPMLDLGRLAGALDDSLPTGALTELAQALSIPLVAPPTGGDAPSILPDARAVASASALVLEKLSRHARQGEDERSRAVAEARFRAALVRSTRLSPFGTPSASSSTTLQAVAVDPEPAEPPRQAVAVDPEPAEPPRLVLRRAALQAALRGVFAPEADPARVEAAIARLLSAAESDGALQLE